MLQFGATARGPSDAEIEQVVNYGGGLSALYKVQRAISLDSVEAAGKALADSCRLERILTRCELLRKQTQLLRAKTVALAFQHGKFGDLKSDVFRASPPSADQPAT